MGDALSFLSGGLLLIVASAVVVEYLPRSFNVRRLEPPSMLQFGIFLGFALTATNTLWWQILNAIVVDQGWATRSQFQDIGKFMDVPLKGGMAVVGLIHLRARHKMQKIRASWPLILAVLSSSVLVVLSAISVWGTP